MGGGFLPAPTRNWCARDDDLFGSAMKGRSVTKADQKLWDALAGIGCAACLRDGNVNPWVSIHHIRGRTIPGAHRLVIPLCAGHHMDGTGEDKSMIAVHPFKKRFELRYGPQMELLEWAMQKAGVSSN